MIKCTFCRRDEAVVVSPTPHLMCDKCMETFLMGQTNPERPMPLHVDANHHCMACLDETPATYLVPLPADPQHLCANCVSAYEEGQKHPAAVLKLVVAFYAIKQEQHARGAMTDWIITQVIDEHHIAHGLSEPQYIPENLE